MPELPEVETTRRGVAPLVTGQRVSSVHIHQPRLRWPVPRALADELTGQTVTTVTRRAKYLLFHTAAGTLLLHLGMSGRLRVVAQGTPRGNHDHLDISLDNGHMLRLNDPRRFGSALWLKGDPFEHPLLATLGPEPLEGAFNGNYLFQRSRGRKQAVKSFLMDSHIVVGVGNIYAAEALFEAGIHPARAAGRIALPRYVRLAEAVQTALREAIRAGGTTLRDYVGVDGSSGWFQLQLKAYARAGLPCTICGTALKRLQIAQRSSDYCPHCQR